MSYLRSTTTPPHHHNLRSHVGSRGTRTSGVLLENICRRCSSAQLLRHCCASSAVICMCVSRVRPALLVNSVLQDAIPNPIAPSSAWDRQHTTGSVSVVTGIRRQDGWTASSRCQQVYAQQRQMRQSFVLISHERKGFCKPMQMIKGQKRGAVCFFVRSFTGASVCRCVLACTVKREAVASRSQLPGLWRDWVLANGSTSTFAGALRWARLGSNAIQVEQPAQLHRPIPEGGCLTEASKILSQCWPSANTTGPRRRWADVASLIALGGIQACSTSKKTVTMEKEQSPLRGTTNAASQKKRLNMAASHHALKLESGHHFRAKMQQLQELNVECKDLMPIVISHPRSRSRTPFRNRARTRNKCRLKKTGRNC